MSPTTPPYYGELDGCTWSQVIDRRSGRNFSSRDEVTFQIVADPNNGQPHSEAMTGTMKRREPPELDGLKWDYYGRFVRHTVLTTVFNAGELEKWSPATADSIGAFTLIVNGSTSLRGTYTCLSVNSDGTDHVPANSITWWRPHRTKEMDATEVATALRALGAEVLGSHGSVIRDAVEAASKEQEFTHKIFDQSTAGPGLNKVSWPRLMLLDVSANPRCGAVIVHGELKSADRLSEKLRSANGGFSPDHTVSDFQYRGEAVGDVVRTAVVMLPGYYTDMVERVLFNLRASGQRIRRIRRSWLDEDMPVAGYKGLNVTLIGPLNTMGGLRHEVQFHTDESWEMAVRTHGTYEKLRTNLVTDQEAETLKIEADALWRSVRIPPGVRRLGDLQWLRYRLKGDTE